MIITLTNKPCGGGDSTKRGLVISQTGWLLFILSNSCVQSWIIYTQRID